MSYIWISINGKYAVFSEADTHVGRKTMLSFTDDINEASVCTRIPSGLTASQCSEIAVKAEATVTRVVKLVKE